MSDVINETFRERLTSDSTPSNAAVQDHAGRAGAQGNSASGTGNAGGSHDDEWQHVEHPSAETEQCQAADGGEEGGNDIHHPMTAPEDGYAAPEVQSAEDSASESATSSRRSFEHLSDDYGGGGSTRSLASSLCSSLDGLLVPSPPGGGPSFEEFPVSSPEGHPLGSRHGTPSVPASPTAPDADEAQLNALQDLLGAATEGGIRGSAGEFLPAAAAREEFQTSSVPGVPDGMIRPMGSSQALHPEVRHSGGYIRSFAAEIESNAEATDLEELPVEDWDSDHEESICSDAMSEVSGKWDDVAKHAAWLATMRAAVARWVPTAAIASVFAWLENWQKNLRALELPSAGQLPARLLGMKCSTLALGVGGITIAVLSSMLYNSRQQNHRLRVSLFERDQDIASMVSRIFHLKESIQLRRIPIIHHVSSVGFSAFPVLPTIEFL